MCSFAVACENHGFNLLKHLHLGTRTKVTAICLAYSQAQKPKTICIYEHTDIFKTFYVLLFDMGTSEVCHEIGEIWRSMS